MKNNEKKMREVVRNEDGSINWELNDLERDHENARIALEEARENLRAVKKLAAAQDLKWGLINLVGGLIFSASGAFIFIGAIVWGIVLISRAMSAETAD